MNEVADSFFPFDICVVGGCGHVGLPLALTFADSGLRVSVYDTNEEAVEIVRSGRMPFMEKGAESVLSRVIGKTLEVSTEASAVSDARYVIVIIGTPVDAHLNPTFHSIRRFFQEILSYLRDGQCVILRSTVYPGTTEKVCALIAGSGKDIRVAFCPERVAEGKAMEELTALPQIVSGGDEEAVRLASELFGKIAKRLVVLSPLEAELAKVFTNAWRYIQFATANQFFMIAAEHGLDFYRIYDALTLDYPRMAGLPTSGFAAGPCLFKDTMQLAATSNNTFSLGHAAMLINEGLPNFVVRMLKKSYPLHTMTVGVLGMAFKADSDDPRESLSYKLRKILEYEAASVICTDPFIEDDAFLPLDDVVDRADLLILGAPHSAYRELRFPDGKPVIDIWNVYGGGAMLW